VGTIDPIESLRKGIDLLKASGVDVEVASRKRTCERNSRPTSAPRDGETLRVAKIASTLDGAVAMADGRVNGSPARPLDGRARPSRQSQRSWSEPGRCEATIPP